MDMDPYFISTLSIWGTLPNFLITTLQTAVHFQHFNFKKHDGTLGKKCLMDSLTLDRNQQTTSVWWKWIPTSSPPFKFEAHFPVSLSQYFKLLYIFNNWISRNMMVPLEKCVWWIAWRWMGTNRLHQFDGQGHPLHLHSSNLRHTFQFSHHGTSNCCTHLSVNNKEPDGTHGKECMMDSLTIDGHQETASP